MTSKKVVPDKVIDLHGIVAALKSKNNAVRSNIIDAIQSQEMHIVGSVSKELKDLYPDLYEDFKTISPKKYMHVRVMHETAAGVLTESYGSSLLGGIPMPERFELVALCVKEKVDLVTSGKSRKDCSSIVKKCALNGTRVLDVDDMA